MTSKEIWTYIISESRLYNGSPQDLLQFIIHFESKFSISERQTEYLTPKEYLEKNISIQLTELNAKSGLSIEDFEFCLTQWSLKCEEVGWEYSQSDEKDLRKLNAGFTKWLNSWVKNNSKDKFKSNGHNKTTDILTSHAKTNQWIEENCKE